jgi:CRP-like cAMP-binding protein
MSERSESIALRTVKETSVVFNCFSDEELKKTMFGWRQMEMNKNSLLFSPDNDEFKESLFLVLEGTVRAEILPAYSEDGVIATFNFGRGRFLGHADEREFLSAYIHSKKAKILVVPKRSIAEMIRKPEFAENFFKMQELRCRPYLRKVQMFLSGVEERILMVFEDMQRKISSSNLPKPLNPVRILHSDLAGEVGSTRETVSRSIENSEKVRKKIDELRDFVKVVSRGGSLPEGNVRERVTQKQNVLRERALEVVVAIYRNRKIHPRGKAFSKDVKTVEDILLKISPNQAIAPREIVIAQAISEEKKN